MKKILLSLAVAALAVVSAQAQLGFDTFNTTRSYVLAAPANLTQTTTNAAFDTLTPIGVAALDVVVCTNTGATGGTLSLTLQTSVDSTNWVNVQNIAFINSTTALNVTNGFYGGTSLYATDYVLLPGTVTTPTASVSAWATPYLAKLPFTNSGALTVTATGNYKLGFNVKDQQRYLRTIWTTGGTSTNFTASAVLTTVSQFPIY